ERLEVENSSLEDKLTVANSKLLEKEYDLSKMPEIEFKGRLVIDRLEKGYEPKNKKVADNWKGILDENKEKKLINNKQLNQAMEKIKMIMQKIISKIKEIEISIKKKHINIKKINQYIKKLKMIIQKIITKIKDIGLSL